MTGIKYLVLTAQPTTSFLNAIHDNKHTKNKNTNLLIEAKNKGGEGDELKDHKIDEE